MNLRDFVTTTTMDATTLVAHVRDAASLLSPIEPTLEDAPYQTWSLSLVYGELEPASVVHVLQQAVAHCRVSGPLSFADVGSGEGFPCLLAASFFPRFERVCGVELVPRLHRTAQRHVSLAADVLGQGELFSGCASASAGAALSESDASGTADAATSSGAAAIPSPPMPTTSSGAAAIPSPPMPMHLSAEEGLAARGRLSSSVRLTCGDFIEGELEEERDWPSCSVVFLNGTCFELPELLKIFKRAEAMRPGSIFILTSHEMKAGGKLFELLQSSVVAASWGDCSVRIYRKRDLPRWAAGVLGRK